MDDNKYEENIRKLKLITKSSISQTEASKHIIIELYSVHPSDLIQLYIDYILTDQIFLEHNGDVFYSLVCMLLETKLSKHEMEKTILTKIEALYDTVENKPLSTIKKLTEFISFIISLGLISFNQLLFLKLDSSIESSDKRVFLVYLFQGCIFYVGKNSVVYYLQNYIKDKKLPNLFWYNNDDKERKKFLIEFYRFIKLDEIANAI